MACYRNQYGRMHSREWMTSGKASRFWQVHLANLKISILVYLHSKATVILSATVSFLNISDITNNKDSLPYISSCISIAVTIGSIILGLLLKRQHQTKIRDTTDDIVRLELSKTEPLLTPAFFKIAKDPWPVESPFPRVRNIGNPLQLTLRSRDVGVCVALYHMVDLLIIESPSLGPCPSYSHVAPCSSKAAAPWPTRWLAGCVLSS